MEKNLRIKSVILLSLLSLIFFPGCGAKTVKPVLDARDQWSLGKTEFEKKDWYDAVQELQKLIYNYPGESFIDSAQFLLAMSYFNQKEYATAAGEFKKVLSSYPASLLADDASFYLASSDMKQSYRAELDQRYTFLALEAFQDFLETYPASEFVDQAQASILELRDRLAKKDYKNGLLYLKKKDYESAILYFDLVIENYFESKWADEALFRKAEAYRLQKKYLEALKEYGKYIELGKNKSLIKKSQEYLSKLESRKTQAQK